MKTEYPYVKAWGALMHSNMGYIEAEVEKAKASGAPWNATYQHFNKDGTKTWQTIATCTAMDSRHYVEAFVARNFPDVIESDEYREYLEEVARGHVEAHLGDCFDPGHEVTADEMYDEAFTIGLDRLIDIGVHHNVAKTVARDYAQKLAQP